MFVHIKAVLQLRSATFEFHASHLGKCFAPFHLSNVRSLLFCVMLREEPLGSRWPIISLKPGNHLSAALPCSQLTSHMRQVWFYRLSILLKADRPADMHSAEPDNIGTK